MDTSKVSRGELIAAVGGVLLIISLFLDWFSASASIAGVSVSASGNAFDVFSGMHIIMLIVGIAAVALAGAAALDAASNVPRGGALVLALLGVGAIGWTLGYDLETSNAGIGAWLALVAAIAIAFGGFEASGERRAAPASSAATTAPTGPATPAGSAGPPPA